MCVVNASSICFVGDAKFFLYEKSGSIFINLSWILEIWLLFNSCVSDTRALRSEPVLMQNGGDLDHETDSALGSYDCMWDVAFLCSIIGHLHLSLLLMKHGKNTIHVRSPKVPYGT